MVPCKTCGRDFNPRQDLGQWRCRIHVDPGRSFVLVNSQRGHDHVSLCCGLGAQDEERARHNEHLYLGHDDILGCVPADHIEVESSRPRQINDLHLLPLLTPGPVPQFPTSLLKQLSVTYGQLEDPTFDTEVDYHVAQAGGFLRKTEDLRDRFRQILETVYGDANFQRGLGSLLQRALDERSHPPRPTVKLARPEELAVYERLFSPMAQQLSQVEYVKRYFMLKDKNAVSVTFLILRAAAPLQSMQTLARITAQHDHW